jgi:hypothetical protein
MATVKHRKQSYLVVRKPDETHRHNGRVITKSFKPFLCPLPQARILAGHVLAIESRLPADAADLEDARDRADLSHTAARLVMERYRSSKTSDAERHAAVQHSIRHPVGAAESTMTNGILPRKAG